MSILAVGVFTLGGYLVYASEKVGQLSKLQHSYAVSPLVVITATATAPHFAELRRVDEDPILPPLLPNPSADPELLPAGLQAGEIRNVVLIVMESVGAQYVAGIGRPESAKWTPHLASFGSSTLAFRNVYAHAPLSTKSLFSILTSRYPVFAFDVETAWHWNDALQTLSGRLKQAGRRTAFFMSGDLKYQRVDKFLGRRGFDVHTDMESDPCQLRKWAREKTIDDRCAVESLARWIDAKPTSPFFAVLWTGQTHWPYFAPKGSVPQTDDIDGSKQRYLSAIRMSDAAIGGVFDHLKERGLLEDTLVVVTGDHGQAFGEHGFRVHANSAYEEETRVPLLLINPRIDGPQTNDKLAGLVDIAPTITHILGLPAEGTWDGRSLFDPVRPNRVYLFVPNGELEMGFREGNQKFIYKAATEEAQVYDLAKDPLETRNIADEQSAEMIRRHLSGWLEQHNRRMASGLAP